jgi:hypothetical protein
MRPLALLLVLAWLSVMASAAIADQVYLSADFNDKPIDQPIGTGGAEVGEPTAVDPYITAIVRSSPLGTPCLEIQDNDTYTAGYVRFELLGSAEVVTGHVVISANLQVPEFEEGGDFEINVREQGSAAYNFAELLLLSGGSVNGSDNAGYLGEIGTYAAGSTFQIILDFDMDAGTYDVSIGGTKVVEDRAHGVTGRGIGGVYFGCLHDSDLVGRYVVDDVSVTDFIPSPVVPTTWGLVKQLLRL